MGDGLKREAKVELIHGKIADERDDKNRREAVEQVEVPQHHGVAQTADHAKAALLRQRADHERDDQRDPERRVHGAGTSLGRLEQRGYGQHEDQKRRHHGRQHAALGDADLVGALEREAALEAGNADEDADKEADETDERVQVAAADTQYHTQRTAQEYQSANHNKSAQEEAGDRSGAAFWRKFLADHCHDECAAD